MAGLKSFYAAIAGNFALAKSRFMEYENIKKIFWTLVGIYMLAISAILRADVAYIDDIGRKAAGYAGWGNFSRYLSVFFSYFLHTNQYLADISPLPQIIAVLLISLASMIIIVRFQQEENMLVLFAQKQKISLWNVAAILPLGLSPYFLECLSYKYDSPYMALSMLGSVFPLLFCECQHIFYLAIVVLGILVSCLTYQASLGIFPVLVIFLAFFKWQRGETVRSVFKLIVYSALGYIIALLVYKFFIMVPADTYVSAEIFPLAVLPKGMAANLKKYFGLIYGDFNRKWLLAIYLLVLSFTAQSFFNSTRNKLLTVLVGIVTVLLSAALAFGPYIALTKPLFSCRAMFGFGVWAAVLAVITVNLKFPHFAKLCCLGLGWCLFVFAFIYGNALEEQQRYVHFRMEMVATDLNSIKNFDANAKKNVQIIGNACISPVIRKMPQYKNVLHRLLQPRFDGSGWLWSRHYFYNYYDLKNMKYVSNLKEKNLPLVKDNYYERIYGNENDWVIELKSF